MIRLGRAAGGPIEPAAKPEELSPGAAHRGGTDPPGHGIETPLRLLDQVRREQRLDRDELRLEHVPGRRVDGPGDVGRQRDGRSRLPPSKRNAGLQHEQRPLIPASGLRSVLAVRFARLEQAAIGLLVLTADQVDLGQRVEDGAGRLAHELQRAAHVERAIERLFRAVEAAQADADLAERCERHAKPVRRAAILLQLHAALGQRQRLFVPVLHQRDVGLVAAHGREHVAGLDEQRQPLGLRERGHRLIEPAFLREGHAREGMHHRQVPPVADGVERGRGLRQVLSDDAGIANLPVAEAELEVRESDGPRVVGALGGLKSFGEKGDAAGGLAAGGGEAAVHPPEVRESGGI